MLTLRLMEEATAGLRERKRVRTRRSIADAALDLFARQGFHATTIPQIAAVAEVSPRTVSGYFPAKEDLAFPDADERISALERRLRTRPPGETTAETLQLWLPELLGFLAGSLAPPSLFSFLSEPHLFGQGRPLGRIARRHHGVIFLQAPFFPVLVRCHAVFPE